MTERAARSSNRRSAAARPLPRDTRPSPCRCCAVAPARASSNDGHAVVGVARRPVGQAVGASHSGSAAARARGKPSRATRDRASPSVRAIARLREVRDLRARGRRVELRRRPSDRGASFTVARAPAGLIEPVDVRPASATAGARRRFGDAVAGLCACSARWRAREQRCTTQQSRGADRGDAHGVRAQSEQKLSLQRPTVLRRALEAALREQLPAAEHVRDEHGGVGLRVAVPAVGRLRDAQRLPQRGLELVGRAG